MGHRHAAFALAALLLTACAATPRGPAPVVQATALPRPYAPAPPPPVAEVAPPPAVAPSAFDTLPGWSQEDHAAAFQAFLAACPGARDPVTADVCRRAARLATPGEAEARAFIEDNFVLQPEGETGLLTAYFTPIYDARTRRSDEFSAPVRPRPADLPPGARQPYADRAAIEQSPAPDALAWMRPEELFFLQIQGSGVLVFPDGEQSRAVFDGANGAPFVGIATPMRREGLLAGDNTSGEAIRAWLAMNRGPRADEIMRLDPRYVFFRLQPDDGAEPNGAAGLPLIAGRAVAVDPTRHALGELLWIDASAPALAGAFPAYRRLAVALDTGSAIKGEVRADLYLGRGRAAGVEAGRVRHVLRLYRLTPIAQTRASLAPAAPRPGA